MAGDSKMVPFISEGGRNISAACVKAFQKAPQSSVMQNCHFGNSTVEMTNGVRFRVEKDVAKFLKVALRRKGTSLTCHVVG